MQAERREALDDKRHHAGRGGRPRADQAGEVERRILDAAAELFLQLGFDGTSNERVAAQAKAGKATLYSRYANKEALFAAVVRDNVERTLEPTGYIRWDLPLHDRLQAAGLALLLHVLQPRTVAFMRVVFTAAHRMPHLARMAVDIGRQGGTRAIASAIVGNRNPSSEALELASPLAAKFLDLAFVPHQMRALMGEEPAVLEADAPGRVADAISLLSAAGWLKPWE